jgi:hypothetical protein
MHTKPVTPVLVATGFWGAQEKGGKQMSILLSSLLGFVLGEVPVLLRGLITTVLLVVLMTYVVMPNLTRLFAKWLFR